MIVHGDTQELNLPLQLRGVAVHETHAIRGHQWLNEAHL
jgi:hypothetical protein